MAAEVARADARVRLPDRSVGPVAAIGWRVAIAVGCIVVTTLLVYVDRTGYRDGDGRVDSLLDALYYATVTLSTTGYGDITPLSDRARLLNVLIVTPLRFLFLIVLVGTTIEVLSRRTREQIRTRMWRARVRDHVVIVGFGVKGAAALQAIREQGRRPDQIVVLDRDAGTVTAAVQAGAIGVQGDAAREAVLDQAGIRHAGVVVVCVARDDTAVLVTLTARRLNTAATIVASVRESQNVAVLRQSGADTVIPTAESAGRMLGLSTGAPRAGAVLEDLLEPGIGLEIVEVPAGSTQIGKTCGQLNGAGEIVIEVNRDGIAHRFDSRALGPIQPGDVLVVIRNVPART